MTELTERWQAERGNKSWGSKGCDVLQRECVKKSSQMYRLFSLREKVQVQSVQGPGKRKLVFSKNLPE